MKVAHFLPFGNVGGTEIATLRVVRAIASAGVDSVVVCLHPAPSVEAFFAREGCETIRVSSPTPSFRKALRYLSDSQMLARVLRQARVDLVHCADVSAGYRGGLAGRLAGVPVLCHVRNRYASIPGSERVYLNAVTYYAFVSKHTQASFGMPISPRRGSVIYDGIATDASEKVRLSTDVAGVRRAFGLEDTAYLITMCARVSPQKDHETLIRAAQIVVRERPDAAFLAIGEYEPAESHFEALRTLVDAAGMSRRFLFTGFRTDVERLVRASDMCVLSTHFEGLPLVLLEAMALRKPVIATAVDGVIELIQDQRTGFLVAHADVNALATQILDCMNDESRTARVAEAAYRMVRDQFTVEAFGKNLVALYGRLLKRGRWEQ